VAKTPAVVVADAVAEQATGLKAALQRPVIKRTKTAHWDDERGEWVPDTKSTEIGIGPVGAAVVALAAVGTLGAALTLVNTTNERLKAQKANNGG